jgi:hypothetical protein
VTRSSRVPLAFAIALSVSAYARGASAQLYFEDVDDAFPGQGCQDGDPEDEGCWTNYLRLSDLDGDGDLDAIFPNARGFFSSPGPQPLEIYLNDGNGDFEPGTVELLDEEVEGAYRVVAIGDVDGDGRRDLFIPSASGGADRLYVQDGSGAFVDEADSRIASRSRSAAARFGDVDGDGDLDLLVAAGYASTDSPPARLYRNDGAGAFELADGAVPDSMVGLDPDDLDLVDVDGDFDLDVLVNAHEGENALWINDGTGFFTDGSSGLPPLDPSAFHYGPAVCDLDGDGDRDIVIDNVGSDYLEQVLINDGTGNFTAENDRLGGNQAGADDNGLVCLDFDDDGDMDLIVMSLSSSGERLFENDGTGNFTRLSGAFTSRVDPTLWMEAGDVDGDARLDIVTAQGEGAVQLERLYRGTENVAEDASGPVIFATSAETLWPEIRFALRDNATSDEGPRVREVEARFGVDEVVPATFMGGDLYRVVVPEDSEDVSVCATDLAGNVGCVEVAPGSGGSGGGSPGSSGSGSGEGGYTPSVTASVGTGGAAGDGGAATAVGTSTGGEANGGTGGDDRAILGDDGCGCRVAGSPVRAPAGLACVGVAFAAAMARRRGRSRRVEVGS